VIVREKDVHKNTHIQNLLQLVHDCRTLKSLQQLCEHVTYATESLSSFCNVYKTLSWPWYWLRLVFQLLCIENCSYGQTSASGV